MIIGYLIAVAVLIGLSAFFSASEMAFNSANRIRLENARDDGNNGARIACIVCDRYDDALSAVDTDTETEILSALKDLSGQEASILSYVDPLVAVLISVLVLGESMTPVQMLGGALILGFTLWNETSGS